METTLRRSQRTPQPRIPFGAQHPYRVQKSTPKSTRCSARLAALNEEEEEEEEVEEEERLDFSFIDDATSLSSGESESESESDEDSDGGGDFSDDSTYAERVDREESYDSRLEEGNEEYERDGFVVGDGEESEISILSEGEEEEEGEIDSEVEDEDEQTDNDTQEDDNTTTPSQTSTSSSSLFISAYPTRTPDFSLLPLSTAAPEDIAEDVTDLMALLSRRCNRDRAPLLLRLREDVLMDGEVVDALGRARRLGFVRGVVEFGDGSVGVGIGAR
ncbi:hypothetical protein BDW02DRAFT_630264 [Decorospora gaudefroyi]|uniref:Uncharacterized protein n=1 Tax=Decorospora gaudefroyi TaxID=184978 RepID=A0A6A5KGS3_9PLEO|nr:hypothetical protein BDW02DRAFT_630264 [Decorospora gaudefroyi]